jgi:hypothetical protein
MYVNIKNSTSVREALVQAGIKNPLDGYAYTLYECGHAFNVEDDPGKTQWYSSVGRSLRTCPKCDYHKLLTKYKRCGCGKPQIGSNVQPSKACNDCPPGTKGSTVSKYAHRKNGHLADPDRGFCIHRNECLTKFIDYATVPCKGCEDFFVIQGNHDALAEVISG